MFDQLTGNERVKNLLKRIVEAGRIPGALLFTGEEGIGKKLFALAIAKALNCKSPRGVEGCGRCPSCVRIGKFNYPQSSESDDWKGIIWTDHPDVGMVVAPKRILLVEQMRLIEREANYRPYEGNARVFLIDDAEKLNDSSANALLKVLEEPPHTSHIVLLTSRPDMLLPTIRSRCQMIRFSPLAPKEIEAHLLQNKIASAGEARVRARVARGSLGRSLESGFDDFVSQRAGMLQLLQALAVTDDRIQLLRSAEEFNDARHKEDYESRLDILETLIRDAWMLSLQAPPESVVNEDLLPQLQQISERLDSRRPASWISQIEEMREQLVVNINRKAATDSLFLTMAAAAPPLQRKRFVPR
ncbi:MAG TPA: DNA polymerase III subunit delta' [Pyrinomonadaceae bacterium]|jgi:DNA polymerase-3 subunit delta'|nr:DNA polymerase III subunit delta' [Pyrinomonadaceae bacterium]